MLFLSSLSTARADRDSALPGQTSKSRQVTVRRAARTEDNSMRVSGKIKKERKGLLREMCGKVL